MFSCNTLVEERLKFDDLSLEEEEQIPLNLRYQFQGFGKRLNGGGRVSPNV